MLLNAGPQLGSNIVVNIIREFSPNFSTTDKNGLLQRVPASLRAKTMVFSTCDSPAFRRLPEVW